MKMARYSFFITALLLAFTAGAVFMRYHLQSGDNGNLALGYISAGNAILAGAAALKWSGSPAKRG